MWSLFAKLIISFSFASVVYFDTFFSFSSLLPNRKLINWDTHSLLLLAEWKKHLFFFSSLLRRGGKVREHIPNRYKLIRVETVTIITCIPPSPRKNKFNNNHVKSFIMAWLHNISFLASLYGVSKLSLILPWCLPRPISSPRSSSCCKPSSALHPENLSFASLSGGPEIRIGRGGGKGGGGYLSTGRPDSRTEASYASIHPAFSFSSGFVHYAPKPS